MYVTKASLDINKPTLIKHFKTVKRLLNNKNQFYQFYFKERYIYPVYILNIITQLHPN